MAFEQTHQVNNKPVRGFHHLIGEKIKKIDAEGINCVIIFTESGKVVAIESQALHYGIPVIELTYQGN